MSTVVFVSQKLPEKNLIERREYKVYFSNDEMKEAIEELRKQVPDLDDWNVKKYGVIEITKYGGESKKFYYEK